MTLGRLIELYQAEKDGKTIMCKIYYYGYTYTNSFTHEVKISEIELSDLTNEEDDDRHSQFYIKDEENEYGDKI